MAFSEEMIKFLIMFILEEFKDKIELFAKYVDKTLIKTLHNFVTSDFKRLSYTSAVEILKKSKQNFEYDLDFGRDLQTEHERYLAEEHYKKPLSNIVYMGMGEPLLNYKNVLKSIEYITSDKGLGMSPKRITVSTAGISKLIKQLGDDEVKFNLALSLHAATDAKRNQIMPINEQNSLTSLSEALRYFYEKTGSRVTFEYIILKDFNDSLEDAKDLAAFAKAVPCKINIIEYNPIDNADFEKAEEEKTDKLAAFLENTFNLIVNVRRSRGKDIDAACGQLANKNKAAH